MHTDSLPKPKVEIGSTKSKDNLFVHYYNDIIEHANRQICFSFRFGNNTSCAFSIVKFELHGSHFILTKIVNLNHRESQSLQEPILHCKQMWNIWEQLRCVAHSPLIVGITIALLISLGTYCPNTKCSGKLCLHKKKLFNLSAEATINVRNARQ